MAKPYDDTWLDGWAEYSYERVFSEAWRLAALLPAEQQWAFVLSELLGRTVPPDSIVNLPDVIARWRID